MEENEVKEEINQVDDTIDNESPKKPKSNIVLIITSILLLVIILGAAFFVLRKTPEDVVEDFIEKFNNSDYVGAFELIDYKGLFALISTTTQEEMAEDSEINIEKNFNRFDKTYEKYKNSKDAKEFEEAQEKIDKNLLKGLYKDVKIEFLGIEKSTKIQGTENLYKIVASTQVSYEGQKSEPMGTFFYVAKIDDEYKIVGGDIPIVLMDMLTSIELNLKSEEIQNQITE